MEGWSLEYVRALDRDVREVLIEEINRVNKRDDDTDAPEDW